MIQRTFLALSQKAPKRTIVRDPRKVRKATNTSSLIRSPQDENTREHNLTNNPLPFTPSEQNQQAVGSSLASYALMGGGMAIGFTIVGVLFGA